MSLLPESRCGALFQNRLSGVFPAPAGGKAGIFIGQKIGVGWVFAPKGLLFLNKRFVQTGYSLWLHITLVRRLHKRQTVIKRENLKLF